MGCRETHGVRSTVRAVNARVAAGGLCALLLCMSPEHRASAQDPAPNAAPEYEDQLIDGGNLVPDVSDDMYGVAAAGTDLDAAGSSLDGQIDGTGNRERAIESTLGSERLRPYHAAGRDSGHHRDTFSAAIEWHFGSSK